MGRVHARAMSQLEEIDFVGYFDPAQKLDPYFDTESYASAQELLRAELDFVVIATPTVFHYELAMSAIAQGVNLLVEKPLTRTLAEAVNLLEESQVHSVIGAVGHIERFNPAIAKMKQLLDHNFLGRVFQISTVRSGPFPNRVSDVGVARDLASHDIDLAMWLGRATYASISARKASAPGRPHEDFFTSVGELENGILVNQIVNWMSPLKERETRVIGEKGMLVADSLRSELYFHELGSVISDWEMSSQIRGPVEGNSTRFAIHRTEPIFAEHLAFQRLLHRDSDSEIATFEDGRQVLRVIEEATL